MKEVAERKFTAHVWQEGNWFVAQCIEIDIASQGETQEEAVKNLREALELYFESPHPTAFPVVQTVEVSLSAA